MQRQLQPKIWISEWSFLHLNQRKLLSKKCLNIPEWFQRHNTPLLPWLHILHAEKHWLGGECLGWYFALHLCVYKWAWIQLQVFETCVLEVLISSDQWVWDGAVKLIIFGHIGSDSSSTPPHTCTFLSFITALKINVFADKSASSMVTISNLSNPRCLLLQQLSATSNNHSWNGHWTPYQEVTHTDVWTCVKGPLAISLTATPSNLQQPLFFFLLTTCGC